jgi:two-component system CheB/CheR fusion protein
MAKAKAAPAPRKVREKKIMDRPGKGPADESHDETKAVAFPVVAIGASAGGLAAFTELLKALPAESGMAFVLIQHLEPRHESALTLLLSKATSMPVVEVSNGMAVEANHVYVIPPNRNMTIRQGTLRLAPRNTGGALQRPIDDFAIALGEEKGNAAIGVILSGTGSDGTQGLKAIKSAGGVTFAQEPKSAEWPAMPMSAIAAGAVDFVLSPKNIAAELARIGRHPYLKDAREVPEGSELDKISLILRSVMGVDFRLYKQATVRRRIARRMALQKIESLAQYVLILRKNREEAQALADDIFIHVTSFFRDPECFQALRNRVLAKLRTRKPDDSLRVWVPGCSTGEEAYSIAMLLIEELGELPNRIRIQIFGTDVQERAVAQARAGIYTEAAIAGVSPARRKRFFARTDSGYQINKFVRDLCVFARHDLAKDPPFSRLDLISCRNVLIYLGAAMQRHVVATFHYALQPEGCLWLGHSESLRDFPDLFSQLEKPHKFYLQKEPRDPLNARLTRRRTAADDVATASAFLPERERTPEAEVERTAERIVLSEFGPAWVVVNQNFEVLNSRGDVSQYLQIPAGRATLSLLRMARDEVRAELTKLLTRARAGELDVWSSALTREKGGAISQTRLEVRRITPVSGPPPAYGNNPEAAFLIVFFPGGRDDAPPAPQPVLDAAPQTAQPGEKETLRQELNLANQRLQAILSERDAANQELTSANEEIQSSNEELQSINEELETSKEELQSSNEELNTVNEELQTRNQELVRLSDDLANLLSSTTMPILMLDNDLRIRRVTQAAERLFNIRQIDVGRPLSDLRLRLSEDHLDALVHRVIKTLVGEELELQDRDGRWHVLRVRPYRTAENRIQGAVLVMVDIDQIRRAQQAADAARAFSESLVQAVQTPLLVLNSDLRIRTANHAFLNAWRLNRSEVEGRALNAIGGGPWVSPELEAALGRLARREKVFEDLECSHELPSGGKRILLIHARQVRQDNSAGNDFQILLAAADVTAQRRAEKIMLEELSRTETALSGSQDALQRSREELRALTASLLNAQEEERRRVSRELHDDVGQSMAKLQFDIERLEQSLPAQRKTEKKSLLTIRDTAATLSNDLRRIAYALHPSSLDHLGLTVALRAYAREFTKRSGIRTKLTTSGVPASVPPDIANCFYRITQETLRNVAKHAPAATLVSIHLSGEHSHLNLTIQDDGPGFSPDAVRGNGGLGLISIEERARLIHGDFKLTSGKGGGTVITVSAPLGRSRVINIL